MANTLRTPISAYPTNWSAYYNYPNEYLLTFKLPIMRNAHCGDLAEPDVLILVPKYISGIYTSPKRKLGNL